MNIFSSRPWLYFLTFPKLCKQDFDSNFEKKKCMLATMKMKDKSFYQNIAEILLSWKNSSLKQVTIKLLFYLNYNLRISEDNKQRENLNGKKVYK